MHEKIRKQKLNIKIISYSNQWKKNISHCLNIVLPYTIVSIAFTFKSIKMFIVILISNAFQYTIFNRIE